MTTIIIFDLDDTLVNCKMKIPRQTYHMLNKFKKLNYFMGIITYNCMANIVANETKLYQYTNFILYEDIDRDILLDKCINQIINDNKLVNVTNIYYTDDRLDNLKAIKRDDVITYHCINMYELYKFKNKIT
jgi:hypothetical protein